MRPEKNISTCWTNRVSPALARSMNSYAVCNELDRVLLVGDVRQHEAVEAGRPLPSIAGSWNADSPSRRDHPPEETQHSRKRSRDSPAGKSAKPIGNLDRQGRVHEIENRDERLDQMAQEFARRPEGTLVISPDNESRRELNLRIHRAMQDTGQVQIDEKTVPVSGGSAGFDGSRAGLG